MNLSEDKRGIVLFLVPALTGWLQIVVILVGHLVFGDAATLLGLGTMGVFLIVMAVLVSQDARARGGDAGGYVALVLVIFLIGYPAYMRQRGRQGAALGTGAGVLAMFLFFVPLIVLPLGAQILAKRLTAHSSPPPLSTSAGTSTKPTTTGVPHENRCDSVSCAIYTWDDTAKTMLAAPENAKKALTLDDPSPESLAWLVNLPTLTHLDLERASRIDDFTPLGKLTELDYLDVWNSKETTLAPLADLVKLETLKLQNSNALVDLGAVASLPNLKELRFMGTSVTDYGPIGMATHLRTLEILMVRAPVDPLGKLASLRDLTLDLKGSAAGLAPLVSLRSLNLWQSNVTDPAQLGKLIGVETLDIPSAKLTTIAFAATMRHLRTIDVDYDSGVSDLAPLRGLPELTDVEASGTSVVDIAPLATCPKLQRLNLEKTKVTTLAPLAAAKLLTTLSVAGADVHDLMPLSKLPVLKTITVQKGQIPDAAMTAFKAAAPTVRIVVTKP